MQRNHGIDVNGEKICALLYADDLLIIGQSAEQLQDLLDSMYGWCRKWKLLINVSKEGAVVRDFFFGKNNISNIRNAKVRIIKVQRSR